MLLCVALVAASCSGDDPLVNRTGEGGKPGSGTGTLFSTVPPAASAPGAPTAKTSLDHEGHFYWTATDNIFIDLGTGSYGSAGVFGLADEADDPSDRKREADFWYDKAILMAASYPVRYTGTDSTDPNSVTIAAVQEQTWPNYANHFGRSGDCGTATAHRVSSAERANHYQFRLDHKAAYLCFLPRVDDNVLPFDTNGHRLYSVLVEDMDGKPLSGTYDFTSGELDTDPANVTNPSSSITLFCGGDDGFAVGQETDAESNAAFMVISPGRHRLRISYCFANYTEQINIPGSVWSFEYRPRPLASAVTSIDVEYDYRPGHLYQVSQELVPEQPTDLVTLDINDLWYQWDAEQTYWDWSGDYSYQKWWRQPEDQTYDPTQGLKKPRYSETLTEREFPHRNNEHYMIWRSWTPEKTYHRGHYNWYSVRTYVDISLVGRTSASPEDHRYFYGHNGGGSFDWGNTVSIRSGYSLVEGMYSTAEMPNANELAWYVIHGQPHYDTETLWHMKGYNDGKTLCRGGVWLLKSDYITGFTGEKTPNDVMKNSKHANEWAQITNPEPAFDLRLAVPIENIRGNYYKKGRPDDTEIDKYFFLPFAGYIQSDWSYSDWDMRQLKLVGVRGAYWSSTPLPLNRYSGGKYYLNRVTVGDQLPTVSTGEAYDNAAYYLNCTENYISVSWEQQNVCRWGMVAGSRPNGSPWFE